MRAQRCEGETEQEHRDAVGERSWTPRSHCLRSKRFKGTGPPKRAVAEADSRPVRLKLLPTKEHLYGHSPKGNAPEDLERLSESGFDGMGHRLRLTGHSCRTMRGGSQAPSRSRCPCRIARPPATPRTQSQPPPPPSQPGRGAREFTAPRREGQGDGFPPGAKSSRGRRRSARHHLTVSAV